MMEIQGNCLSSEEDSSTVYGAVEIETMHGSLNFAVSEPNQTLIRLICSPKPEELILHVKLPEPDFTPCLLANF